MADTLKARRKIEGKNRRNAIVAWVLEEHLLIIDIAVG
jgi:hypothetical protein